jgi:CheY-like chemotaxis protein
VKAKSSLKSPLILIVDDDKDDHSILEMAIKEVITDARIANLYDGSEVKDFLLKKNKVVNGQDKFPDIIFLDLNMTRIGGRETIYLLKKDEEMRNIPVIVLTTGSDEKEKDELLRLGASDFYTKPVDLSDLVDIVRKVQTEFL